MLYAFLYLALKIIPCGSDNFMRPTMWMQRLEVIKLTFPQEQEATEKWRTPLLDSMLWVTCSKVP